MRKIKLNNNHCDKVLLLCLMMMTSSKNSSRMVSKQLKRINEKPPLFYKRSTIGFLSTPQLKD